ncbi:MAG: hypothetical protein CVV51_05080 [Spirochaetae bacterium HGW-Spirochaetae-7]|nr:MAG: hypothetical protein CVV51_05080 [Spirochaetae bacterium HGW-Spirochaetae-7]
MPALASAQGQVKTFEPSKVVAAIGTYCSACHGWASGYDGIIGSGKIVPGDPGASLLISVVESGYMPPAGPKFKADELDAVRAWIAAGAPGSDVVASDATSGATAVDGAPGLPVGKGGFLGFPSKAAYHRAAGWTSSGLLLAAGAVGAVRAYNLITAGHDYRDANGIGEDQISALCSSEIQSLWSDGQALRWTHVGLLVAGETIYLGNAITGIQMLSPAHAGPPNRSDLHRWAFFTHAGLMAAEVVLGFLTTDALSKGDHELVSSLGVAHAAVGLAIPVVMIASGVVIGQ